MTLCRGSAEGRDTRREVRRCLSDNRESRISENQASPPAPIYKRVSVLGLNRTCDRIDVGSNGRSGKEMTGSFFKQPSRFQFMPEQRERVTMVEDGCGSKQVTVHFRLMWAAVPVGRVNRPSGSNLPSKARSCGPGQRTWPKAVLTTLRDCSSMVEHSALVGWFPKMVLIRCTFKSEPVCQVLL